MAAIVADGTILSLGSTLATAVNITAATNAAECVVTLAVGHGSVVGDFLFISSGWPALDGRTVRVKTVSTNDVTLEGINTTDVTRFPAGGGLGTSQRVTAWTNIGQITGLNTEGGDQNYFDFQYLDQTQSNRIPTNKSPIVLALTLADDITLAQNATIRAAEATGAPRPVRMVYRNGTRTVASGFWSMGNMASLALGQANSRSVSVALSCLPQDYAT